MQMMVRCTVHIPRPFSDMSDDDVNETVAENRIYVQAEPDQ